MKKLLIICAVLILLPTQALAAFIPGVSTPIPYTNANCSGEYYTYQRPLVGGAPTLADLFAGTAHFQSPSEAQAIIFTWNQYSQVDAEKMPIIYNPADHKYYSYIRGFEGINGRIFYNLQIFSSIDGFNFSQVGKVFDPQIIYDLYGKTLLGVYDAHVSIDYSFCPTRYIMTFECNNGSCASSSTIPFEPLSWSTPTQVISVINYDTPTQKSASVPVLLVDGANKYFSWSVVDTGLQKVSSQSIVTQDPLSFIGTSTIGSTILPADSAGCTSSWDCNNRDKQDWKKEGDYYYLIYNGANYHGCDRTSNNNWGISVARSTSPLSGYSLPGVGKILESPSSETCAISYPVVNNIDGELYMYYAYTESDLDNLENRRSKLVWNNPSPTPPPTPPLPGDFNTDGSVDIFDYNELVTGYGTLYDIFDYNELIANYGS